MSIITLTCPVCGIQLGAERFDTNRRMLKHHEEEHPTVALLIKDNLIEVGRLKDKIGTIIETTKRVSGYKISH